MRRSALLVGAVLLSVTACKSASSDSAAPAPKPSQGKPSSAPVDAGAVVRAAVAATGATTATVDTKHEMSAAGTQAVIATDGTLDMKADQGKLRVKLTATSSAQQPPVRADEVFHGGKVYFRMPQSADGDTAWRAVPQADTQVHYLLRTPMNDPEHLLRQAALAQKVTEVGKEKANGVPTVHYRGTLGRDALTLRAGGDFRTKLDQLFVLTKNAPFTADVWVDARGRVTRTKFASTLPGMGSTVTMNLTNLGKPLTPPVVPKGATEVPASMVKGALTG
ncbi:hypothetical protein ABT160_23290 [Streptomyces sp. NPDC001941]|uniref:hypothetical protein n=1 Tax=Streptomyces sp. NPDC001941 TaxID=3154659 RepID=UPI00331D2895